MSNWYIINDIEEFVETTRILVYDLFGQNDTNFLNNLQQHKTLADLSEDETEEINNVLTHQESMVIAKKIMKTQVNKKTQSIRYAISDKLFNTLIENLNTRMVSNMLHRLANNGYLEIAYDSDINDFVFWPKDEPNNQTP